jgi:LPS-assembly protein
VNKITLFVLAITCALPKLGICINEDVNFDDWIEDQKNKLCQGYYQEPEYPFPGQPGKIANQPINIESDQAHLEPNGKSIFSGHTVATEGNQTIKSDSLTITKNPETKKIQHIYANGNVTITEPGLRIDGNDAEVLYDQDKRIINNANYRLYERHGRGHSTKLTTYGRNKIELPKGSYTTCSPTSNLWHLRGKIVKLNKETGRGEAWHTYLYIKNMQVFYWPYMNFPIDKRRETGFLQPALESSSKHGTTLITPFYWNLAANYDATFTPQHMGHRGFKFDNEFRYLNQYNSSLIHLNFLPHDRGYRNGRLRKLEKPTITNPKDSRVLGLKDNNQRYFMAAKHTTRFDKNWDFEIDYARAGDDNYLYDFTTDLNTPTIMPITSLSGLNTLKTVQQPNVNNPIYTNQSTTQLLQKSLLRYKNQYGSVTTTFSQYQSLHPYEGPSSDQQYQMLPNITGQFNHSFVHNIDASLQADYTQFKFDETKTTTKKTIGQRYHTRPAISRPLLDEAGIFLRPRIQLDTVNYSTKLSPTDKNSAKAESPSRTIPLFDLNSGLIFEREIVISKSTMLQTLEPRAYFLYVPYKNQQKNPSFDSGAYTFDYSQLFRDNRYSGYDRVSEAKQVALGLVSKFETETGEEKASIGIGRIRYFQDRKDNGITEVIDNTTRWSPIAAIASYRINPNWNITANVVREKLNKSRSGSLTAQYTLASNKVINVGYQFQRNDSLNSRTKMPNHTRQINTSFGWRIDQNIGLLGKLDYDLQQRRAMKILSGLEMHTCCTIVRIVWFKFLNITDSTRVWKKFDHAIGAQLVFKGLGSDVGNMSYNKFTAEIAGYTPSDDEF